MHQLVTDLGVAPEIIFIKKTSGTSDWVVGALEWTKYLELNGNPALELQMFGKILHQHLQFGFYPYIRW
jgi:hypothetical protein